MRTLPFGFLLFGSLALTLPLAQASAETLFVMAQKVGLKAKPAMSEADVATLQRGDSVDVVSTEGAWLQVQKGESRGWVSKLFLTKTKPIGAAALATEVPASEAKTSRRRESSYAVSASSRGLLPIERTRNGRESYRADNEALAAVIKFSVTPSELQQFVSEGQAAGGKGK